MGVFSTAIRRLFMAGASPDDIVAAVEEMEQSCLRFSIPRQPSERKEPERVQYSDDFQAFWQMYPERERMSKQEAYDQWKKISKDNRVLATKALPLYIADLEKQRRAKQDPKVVHACRFLSKNRAESLLEGAQRVETAAKDAPVHINRDDPRYRGLSDRWKRERGKSPPLVDFGSYFPKEWIA